MSNRLHGRGGPTVLVVEAPLSTCHDTLGNPTIRGEFESGRGWYYGAGATVTLAAIRFVEELAPSVPDDGGAIFIAEAFLSHKRKVSGHADDASIILNQFWSIEPACLKERVVPIGTIDGVPPVRVFPSSGTCDSR